MVISRRTARAAAKTAAVLAFAAVTSCYERSQPLLNGDPCTQVDAHGPGGDGWEEEARPGWHMLDCERDPVERGLWPRGSGLISVYFPGALSVSPDGVHVFYSIVQLPYDPEELPYDFPDGEGEDPNRPAVIFYLLNRQDYSIVRLGEMPGPAGACSDAARILRSGPADPDVFSVCTVFGGGRYMAYLNTYSYSECEPSCPPRSSGTPCGDWMPGRLSSAPLVGWVEEAAPSSSPRRTDGMFPLVTWWNARAFMGNYPDYEMPCAANDAVYPGTNPTCPENGGPCCRCSSDADCRSDERCTGRTAGGITYCLRPE